MVSKSDATSRVGMWNRGCGDVKRGCHEKRRSNTRRDQSQVPGDSIRLDGCRARAAAETRLASDSGQQHGAWVLPSLKRFPTTYGIVSFRVSFVCRRKRKVQPDASSHEISVSLHRMRETNQGSANAGGIVYADHTLPRMRGRPSVHDQGTAIVRSDIR